MRLFLSLFFLFTSLYSLEYRLSDERVANGQTLLVEIKKEDGTNYSPLRLGEKKLPLLQHPKKEGYLYSFIPISYYEKPSQKEISLTLEKNGHKEKRSIPFSVVDGEYEKEQLQVDQAKVTLSAADQKRATLEYQEAMRIYNSVTPKSYTKQSDFTFPLDSKITSDFGKARVYNTTLKGYHSGTDFRAAVGTPIAATNDGVVMLVKDRFYAGGSIIIDHGRGLYSSYFHMSSFNVELGQKVKKGEILGLSGATGRVTGPHLHFGIRLHGVQVDPLQFIEVYNSNLLDEENR